ncbi:MAG: TolC family protein [Muribaculaceae bacterium]|nr:TolC family protein [Muribaculaceae bacterium]
MRFNSSILTSLLCAGISFVTAAQTPADTLRLSREECVAIALQESPTVKVADLEVKRMDYSKKEVLASLFPSIDFSGAYQRSIELQTVSMNMGGQSQQFKMGTDNVWNFGFSAAMPLVNASLWKSISLSDTQILQSLENARASRLDMVNGINQAYYALMLAIDSREVIKANYDLAKFNADIYKKQFEAGTASEYDVLRSSVQVTNIEPELLQADIAVKQCQLQLKVLMGMDAEVTVMPTIDLRDMKREMYGYALDGDRTLSRNTSLRSIDLSHKLAEQNVTLQKMAWVPSLAATFNINWNAMSNGNALKNQIFNPYSTVGLALQVPIFSGGSKLQKLRQAQVQVKEIELQRENLVNSLNMQVDLALDNIDRQVRQINSSESGMVQAAKALEIMQKSFEIGAATYLDLRDSEMANTSAQLAYLQSIYNYLISTSELDTLLGKEEALGIPSESSPAK